MPISRPLFELIRSGNRGYPRASLVLVVRRLSGNADNPASALATAAAIDERTLIVGSCTSALGQTPTLLRAIIAAPGVWTPTNWIVA